MEVDNPTFTVIVPTYNRAHLIEQTVNSILNQKFKSFELIIVDDGSTDNTDYVISKIKDPRLYYFKKENGERGAARNFGAERAKGRYFNFFDSDDLMYADHLAVAYHLINQNNEPEFFHLGYDIKNEDGSILNTVSNLTSASSSEIMFDNKLSCNGVFVRRDIAHVFKFNETRDLVSSEDWELWIRLLSRFEFRFSNEVTSAVLNHDQRSLFTILPEKIVKRDLLMIKELKKDNAVMDKYGRKFRKFEAERYTFFMLSYSQIGAFGEVGKWAWRSFRIYPWIIFTKRFIASIKNSIIS